MSYTEKVYWDDVKDQIKQVEPKFFGLVEDISPGKEFPLYMLKFPFGTLVGDKLSQFIPSTEGAFLRLSDPSLPTEIQKDIGYGASGAPLGMLLDKRQEWVVDLNYKNLTIPMALQQPGTFFSYTKVLDDTNIPFNYSPMGLMSLVSGARSLFLLPSVGADNKLTKLKRSLKIQCKQPKSLYDHFSLSQSILSSDKIENQWCSTILYFSEPWVKNIKENPEWYHIQKYFYNMHTATGMFSRSLPKYTLALSIILDNLSAKPLPYYLDTYRHLTYIMAGEIPGFSPQVDDSLCPIEVIQESISEYYGLNQTAPTILGPTTFEPSNPQCLPVYYSLQYPTSYSFSPKLKQSSMMADIRKLAELCSDIITEFKKDNEICSNTIMQNLSKDLDVKFFHNSNDIDNVITPVDDILCSDTRFSYASHSNNHFIPAKDGKFFRGCVQISHKQAV